MSMLSMPRRLAGPSLWLLSLSLLSTFACGSAENGDESGLSPGDDSEPDDATGTGSPADDDDDGTSSSLPDDDDDDADDDDDDADDDDDDDDDDDGDGDDDDGDDDDDVPIDPCPGPADPIPCVNGEAGGFPCQDVSLLGHLEDDDMTGAAATDVWGWTYPEDPRDRDFALLATLAGLAVVEVTDACDPQYLGYLPANGANSTHYDVKVVGHYAVVVSEKQGHGMQVLDLMQVLDVASPPVKFEALAVYDGISNSHNIVVDEQSGFVAAVGSNKCSGGLHAIDMSDPAAPSSLGCWGTAGYIHDAQCVTYDGPDGEHAGKQICLSANGGSKSISVVDMSDPSTGIELSRAKYPQAGYSHQGWLTDDHRYFLHGDEFDEMQLQNTRTMIWDLQDLDAPVLVGEWSNPDAVATDHNQYTRGNFVYQGNYMSGIRILDLTDIANGELTEAGYFDTSPNKGGIEMQGVWSVYPYFRSGATLVSERQRGLFIVYPPPWNGSLPE